MEGRLGREDRYPDAGEDPTVWPLAKTALKTPRLLPACHIKGVDSMTGVIE